MATTERGTQLILASASAVRRQLLAQAGLAFDVVPAAADEREEMTRLGRQPPASLASALAKFKALDVARRFPQALVVGCDQVLAMGEQVFTKPPDDAAARRALMELRGRSHHLHAGVALASGERVIWEFVDTAELVVRDFSDAFLDDYMAQAGSALTASVGSYQLEGRGVQLFERIDGDYFTILGLPLLPLLGELRRHGVVAA